MIEFKKVSKNFNKNNLFTDINIKFEGKKCKIKGANGVGKSVLLKLIVGYSIPNSGEVYYDENRLRDECDFLADAGISINAPEFISNWTGLENIMYLAKIKKVNDNKKINELIDLFGLKNDIRKKYKYYSLGMKQKLRIIQAVMNNPKYLILDEPFDALDYDTKSLLKDYLDDYLSNNKDSQLIFTSHEEDDDEFASDIFLIKDNSLLKVK